QLGGWGQLSGAGLCPGGSAAPAGDDENAERADAEMDAEHGAELGDDQFGDAGDAFAQLVRDDFGGVGGAEVLDRYGGAVLACRVDGGGEQASVGLGPGAGLLPQFQAAFDELQDRLGDQLAA